MVTTVISSTSRQQYTRVVEEACALARTLERGQAEAPMTQLFEQLHAQETRSELVAILLPLTHRALRASLRWLTTSELASPLANIVMARGHVALALGGTSWVIEAGPRQYQALDNEAAFVTALEQVAAAEQTSPGSTLSIQAPGAGGLQPLRLNLVASPQVLADNPALLARLCTTAHLGILTGDMHYPATEADQKVMNALADNMPALWSVMAVDELEEDPRPPASGWWAQFRTTQHHLVPKPVALTTHIKPALAPLLTDLADDNRSQLQLRVATRALLNAIDLLADQHEQRARQAQTRVEREQRAAKAQEPDAAAAGKLRQALQECRQLIQEHGPMLNKQLTEASRAQRGATGQLNGQLTQYLGNLSAEDLQQEPTHSQIKLTVDSRYLDNLLGMLSQGIQRDCQNLTGVVLDQLEALRAGIIKTCLAGNLTRELSPPALLSKELWGPLAEQIELKINYRGSMPKRGVLDRFKEGRQGAMGFMMMASMAAMVFGGNLRDTAWFGPSIGVIFLGSMVYSVISWKRDDQERMGQELDRVRDSLQGELQRLLSDIQRELLSRLQEAADGQRKFWLKALEQRLESTQQQNQAVQEAAKREQQDRQRTAEKQRTELDALRQGISRIKREADQLGKSHQTV
jgi:Skp family chaperone for outer membrane proteins